MSSLNFYTDFCPCGSGQVIADCCLTKRVDTTPPSPQTNHQNVKCYARSLGDCSEDISREHYISESILRLRNPRGLIDVVKAPWLADDQIRTIPARTFATNILCKRHNEALSGLDGLAHKFFSFLVETTTKVDVLLLNGIDIERWFLKLLCGSMASGNVKLWEPPKEWLDILFGNDSVSSGCGLHYVTGQYRSQIRRHELRVIQSTVTGEPVAVTFIISGFPFLFAMEPLPPLKKTSLADTSYHPKAIRVNDDGKFERIVHLGWKEGTIVFVNRGRPYNL